jgi:hypothetical protein
LKWGGGKFLLATTIIIAIFACQRLKDEPLTTSPDRPKSTSREYIFESGSDSPDGVDVRDGNSLTFAEQPIILGAKKANPYSVKNMTAAWNSLYPDYKREKLAASHRYVRFKPANLSQAKILSDERDLILNTFPLDYEIVSEGGFYDDPNIPNNEFPWLYTVVKADYQFPAVPYEILENLVLAPVKSAITRRSFKMVNDSVGVTYRLGCDPECPNWPECEEDPEIGCGDTEPHEGSGGSGGFYPPSDLPPCDPNDPLNTDWEHCQEDPEPVVVTLNGCGCRRTNTRYPTGCVKVVDTQLPSNSSLGGTNVHLAGVNDVKVVWWDGWFGLHSTHTDENGCWQIKEAEYGRGYLRIYFDNDKARMRGYTDIFQIWDYAFTLVDDVGYIDGPDFSNITRIYRTGGDPQGRPRLFWFAATGMNALSEFYGYASSDGIVAPPQNLEVFLTTAGGGASAPMFNKTGTNVFSNFAINHVFGFLFSGVVQNNISSPFQALADFFSINLPDVVYGYNNRFQISDRVKEVFYHEYGHTAHFNGLGGVAATQYWNANINHVINNVVTGTNPPWGVRGTAVANQRTAIIESWAAHIGRDYADRTYGLSHSLFGANGIISLVANRWLFQSELFLPDVSPAPILPGVNSWVPEGLYLDLIDNNAANPAVVIDPLAGPDVILGFTNATCFRAVTLGRPEVLTAVEANLNTSLPPGVTAPMVRTLLNAYGY